jgi:hypothetical protein
LSRRILIAGLLLLLGGGITELGGGLALVAVYLVRRPPG